MARTKYCKRRPSPSGVHRNLATRAARPKPVILDHIKVPLFSRTELQNLYTNILQCLACPLVTVFISGHMLRIQFLLCGFRGSGANFQHEKPSIAQRIRRTLKTFGSILTTSPDRIRLKGTFSAVSHLTARVRSILRLSESKDLSGEDSKEFEKRAQTDACRHLAKRLHDLPPSSFDSIVHRFHDVLPEFLFLSTSEAFVAAILSLPSKGLRSVELLKQYPLDRLHCIMCNIRRS